MARTETISGTLIALVALAIALTACGRSEPLPGRPQACIFDSDCAEGLRCVNRRCVVVEEGDGGAPRKKRFGEPCAGGEECESGHCLAGPSGSFCTVSCAAEACPATLVCKEVPGEDGTTPLCAVPQPLLCQACESDADCGASGADRCLAVGDDRFCGQDCTRAGCPDGYDCTDVPGGRQCTPRFGVCDCTPDTLGMVKGCSARNVHGVCYGAHVCQADGGFTACSARSPELESCNGRDDDCDGLVDDLLAPGCARSNAFGVCTGAFQCRADGGMECDVPEPAAEACNLLDDDCDGKIDEDFRDPTGRYVARRHCGGCGNDCDELVPRATATECVVPDAGAPSCRATACEVGYFPYADGGLCMKLPDTLCRPCVVDADCVGPGSACLTLGKERVCGRDCGPGSAYPACPTGYRCSAWDGGQQCVPVTGTCECTAAHLGTVRSCALSTCSGYQTCASTSVGPSWSACDVASYNPEICDAIDNNCDGRVDEGFRNSVTGKYDAVQSCGFCNNDCTKYWSPTLQHTTGVCDATPAMPVCRMGPCLTETSGGVTYEWVDVNRELEDGCECRRVQGNTTVDLPDRAPGTSAASSYVDQNCDGIDGVIGDALFVSASAAPGGSGSLSAPYRTIGAAIGAFSASGKKYILVAEGIYRENALVTAGMQLFGGYTGDFKKRDPVLHQSILVGQEPSSSSSGPLAAVHIENVSLTNPETVVSGFIIFGHDVSTATPDDQDGAPSYTVYLRNAGPGVVVTNNELTAGRGGRGGRGSNGAQGYGRQSSNALDGRAGNSSGRQAGLCPVGFLRQGGAGGVNPTCPSASASRGGNVVCPVFDWASTPIRGNQQEYTSPDGGTNGRGGWDWSFDLQSGSFCSHVTESGFPSDIQDHDGADGLAGADGAHGAGGAGAPSAARLGTISGGRWSAGTARPSGGTNGVAAAGGGGGGAGGGTARHPTGMCGSWEYGATGGGGGAGGCGGSGGRPGGAGGASIALFATYSASVTPAQAAKIEGNRIRRALGGQGGNGGFGGAGGLGGAGGFGGRSTTWSGSIAGKGGEGGNGGSGGGGGGGAGGPSFGILAFNADVTGWGAQNVFLTGAASSTGGQGGAGGSSSGSTATGTPGVNGAFADAQSLVACSPGCPPGQTCDANGVCVLP